MHKKKMNKVKGFYAAIIFVVFICVNLECVLKSFDQTTILYSTDISMNGDFDDYFDLVSITSLNNVKLKIIVDGNDVKEKQSGVSAVKALYDIGGGYRYPPIVIGRDDNLISSRDMDVSNDLLKILEETKGKIDVVSVGSLRDIAALYNNSPELFESKVQRIWVFAGDAEGTMTEHNVALDETAFLCIMNSEKFEIYWIPCFQNGIWTVGANASYFTLNHNEVLHNADYRLQKWFLYRDEKIEMDFEDYIIRNPDISEFMSRDRNIWCASLFPLMNNSIDGYLKNYNQERGININLPFGFTERKVTFSEGGKVEYGKGNTINVFEVYDYEEYVEFSKYVMRTVYSRWSTPIK